MLIYSTTTGTAPFDPAGFAAPEVVVEHNPHTGCVHSIGYCSAEEWD